MTIVIENTTSTKEIVSTYKEMKKLYEERRKSEINGIVDFLMSHPNEGFTANEMSKASGLSVQSIVAGLGSKYPLINFRTRKVERKFVRLLDDGTVDFNETTTTTTKVREYFYDGRKADSYRW